MNKTEKRSKAPKKLSVANLQHVVGGEPKIKITVENQAGTSRAENGE